MYILPIEAIKQGDNDLILPIIDAMDDDELLSLDEKRHSVAHFLAINKNVEAMKRLQTRVPQALYQIDATGSTPLQLAVEVNGREVIEYLLRVMPASAVVTAFATPVHKAAYEFQLAKHLGSPHCLIKDTSGAAPIHIAVSVGDAEAVSQALTTTQVDQEQMVDFICRTFEANQLHILDILIPRMNSKIVAAAAQPLVHIASGCYPDASKPMHCFVSRLSDELKRDFIAHLCYAAMEMNYPILLQYALSHCKIYDKQKRGYILFTLVNLHVQTAKKNQEDIRLKLDNDLITMVIEEFSTDLVKHTDMLTSLLTQCVTLRAQGAVRIILQTLAEKYQSQPASLADKLNLLQASKKISEASSEPESFNYLLSQSACHRAIDAYFTLLQFGAKLGNDPIKLIKLLNSDLKYKAIEKLQKQDSIAIYYKMIHNLIQQIIKFKKHKIVEMQVIDILLCSMAKIKERTGLKATHSRTLLASGWQAVDLVTAQCEDDQVLIQARILMLQLITRDFIKVKFDNIIKLMHLHFLVGAYQDVIENSKSLFEGIMKIPKNFTPNNYVSIILCRLIALCFKELKVKMPEKAKKLFKRIWTDSSDLYSIGHDYVILAPVNAMDDETVDKLIASLNVFEKEWMIWKKQIFHKYKITAEDNKQSLRLKGTILSLQKWLLALTEKAMTDLQIKIAKGGKINPTAFPKARIQRLQQLMIATKKSINSLREMMALIKKHTQQNVFKPDVLQKLDDAIALLDKKIEDYQTIVDQMTIDEFSSCDDTSASKAAPAKSAKKREHKNPAQLTKDKKSPVTFENNVKYVKDGMPHPAVESAKPVYKPWVKPKPPVLPARLPEERKPIVKEVVASSPIIEANATSKSMPQPMLIKIETKPVSLFLAPPFDKIPPKITELILSFGHLKAFLIGGATRDCYLKKTADEFDLVVIGTQEEIDHFKLKLPEHKTDGEPGKETYTFCCAGWNVDLKFCMQKEGESYKETLARDAKDRDYSCNAIYANPLEIVDPCGGLEHMKKGILEFANPDSSGHVFSREPKRLLRGIRFIKENGWQFSPAVDLHVHCNKEDVHTALFTIPDDWLKMEYLKLVKCLGGECAAQTALDEYGLLDHLVKKKIVKPLIARQSDHVALSLFTADMPTVATEQIPTPSMTQ